MKKWKRKLLKCCFCCMVVLFLFVYSGGVVKAYIINGCALTNPGNVKYKIGTTMGTYTSELKTSTEKWAINCPEIGVSLVGTGENIYFYGDLGVNNGNYGVCYHHSNDSHTITFYGSFTRLSSSEKNETIVHEVGHALGLAHSETGKESISVMRAYGFNGKAYPLADDKLGIASLYR